MKIQTLIALLLPFTLLNCATTKDSILLGVSTGAVTGATTGALIAQRNKGTAALTMATVGAVIGGIAAYFVHQGMDKREKQTRRDTLFNLDKYGIGGAPTDTGGTPSITFPMVEEQKVEAQVKGKKLIGPHKIWVISEDAHWVLDGNEPKKEENK